MKAMSPVEASRFLEAVKGTRQYAVFNFALTTGMRSQEYRGLKWADVDLEKGSATVQRLLSGSERRAEDGPLLSLRCRDRAERYRSCVYVKALLEHKRKQGIERLRIGSEWQDHKLVFPTTIGTPIRSHRLQTNGSSLHSSTLNSLISISIVSGTLTLRCCLRMARMPRSQVNDWAIRLSCLHSTLIRTCCQTCSSKPLRESRHYYLRPGVELGLSLASFAGRLLRLVSVQQAGNGGFQFRIILQSSANPISQLS